MKRHEVIISLLLPILEMGGIIGIFFIAYNLRQITDGIPLIQLPIPYISPDQFIPFIISGVLLWGVIFSRYGLYKYEVTVPLWDTMKRVIIRAGMWFIAYIALVYMTTGFLFMKEIPRLIIGYVYILSTVYAIFLRWCLYSITALLYRKEVISKNHILIIDDIAHRSNLDTTSGIQYIYASKDEHEKISELLRKKHVDIVLLMTEMTEDEKTHIIKLCSVYGISFCYPSISASIYHISHEETFIGSMPVIRASSIAMSVWDRILKRLFDIVFGGIFFIILIPVYSIIILLIWIEDPSGPAIYKNLRVGLSGKLFSLYKFRYMYWKYSTKDAYHIDKTDDTALAYEEQLKETSDTRNGPLYKIANDPRKTRIGKILERFSLDELPQLWNVIRGDMSLVGPRPHQPREVDQYEEHHHQVLTIKPGITGMAQVSGREKNSFDEEVTYDVYYIEHYSILLDMIILIKTIGVVFIRAFRQKNLEKVRKSIH